MNADATPGEPTIEDLLRHEPWLRRLVRSLVTGGDVDDVLQQTWMAALHRPAGATAPGSWLARVARNFAQRQRRTEQRRRRIEEAAARPETLPSDAEALESLTARHQVTQAVLELPEPYRAAVLLRYLHEAPIAAIAARMHISEANARQRITRGLELVRRRLAERHGSDWRDLRALQALIVPAAAPPSALPLVFTGAFLMSKSAAVAVIAVMGLCALFALHALRTPPVPVTNTENRAAPVGATTPGGSEVPAAPTVAQVRREQVAPPAAVAAPVLHGRVLDTSGQPIAGAKIGLRTAAETAKTMEADVIGRQSATAGVWLDAAATDTVAPLTESDEMGRFALPLPAGRGGLVVAPPYVVLRSWMVDGDATGRDGVLLVVAPAVDVAGSVRDGEGEPLAGVQISVAAGDLAGFPEVLDETTDVSFKGTLTRADGSFTLHGLPADRARLTFRKEGFSKAELKAGAHAVTGEQVVLRRVETRTWTIGGRVFDHLGRPVAGATVGLGAKTVATNAQGAFRLQFFEGLPLQHRGSSLHAAKPGFRTKVLAGVGERLLAAPDTQLLTDIRFEGEALTIEGRVLKADGTPWAQVCVFPWHLPDLMDEGTTAEDLAVGEEITPLRLGSRKLRVHAVSDAEGGFSVPGLNAQSYRLRVFDPQSMVVMTTEPIPAGTKGVVIRLSESAIIAEVRGRVVSPGGQPLEGIDIQLLVYAYQSEWEHRGAASGVVHKSLGKTDAQGRFVLRGVPSEAQVDFTGPRTQGRGYYADQLPPGPELEVVVARLCYFRLELKGELAGGRMITFSDARGQQAWIASSSVGRTSFTEFIWIREGATPVLSVSEAATTMKVYGDKELLAEVPVRLVFGDINVIRQ